MSKEEAHAPAKQVDEDDLDDLDDLLDDFAGEVLSKPPGSGAEAGAADTRAEPVQDPEAPLNDELMVQIEDLVKDMKIEDPETKAQFEQLVKNFEEDVKAVSKGPKNFDSVMKETMERLKTSGKDIDEQIKNDQAGANPEDMLSQLLAGLGSGEGGDLDMSKLLADMLEQLSSKEVIYEPIKDLNSKLPDYLKEKKDTLSKEQYDNYTKQYEITTDIVAVFEDPTYNDEDTQQRANVNSLLESLQELGQPPSELVGGEGEFPGFGGLGAAGAAGDGLGFDEKDLPPELGKELEENCKQQ